MKVIHCMFAVLRPRRKSCLCVKRIGKILFSLANNFTFLLGAWVKENFYLFEKYLLTVGGHL